MPLGVTDSPLGPVPRHSRLVRVALAVAVLAILSATLFPSDDKKEAPLLRCLICGERGLADVILNVMLFAPLGAALALAGVRLRRVCLGGAAFSAAIECAQLFIPGRDSSLSDVLSNTAGAVLGCVLVRYVPRAGQWEGRRAIVSVLAAIGLAASVTTGTGLLLHPSFPASAYYGQWTPNLGHLEWYRGRVLDAHLGALAVPPYRLDSSVAVRRLLLEGAVLRVRATAGPAVPALASLFSVYDEQQREIVLLGPDRDALVFRYRTRSADWRLDQPDLRVPGALASISPGDPLDLTVWAQPRGYCVILNGARTCRLGFTAGQGWSLLLYAESFPPWLMRLLDVGWLAVLWVPVGFSARARGALWAAGSLLVGLGLAPVLTGLLPTPATQWVGGLAGALAGMTVQAFVRNP